MSRRIDSYDEEFFGSKSVGWYVGWFVLIICIVGIVGGVLSFAFGWFGEAKRQISPTNVKAQWQFAYDYDRALDSIARQVCDANMAYVTEPDPAIKSARQSQLLAQKNNYARVEAQYDARLADAFRAKYIRPHDVPAQAPTLQENLVEVGCTH